MRLLFLLLFLTSCNEGFLLKSQTLVISSASVTNGRLLLAGSNLQNISYVSAVSANLSGYTMEIESKNSSSVQIKLTHASNNALSLAIGTVLTFTVATATAQTTVNLTIEAAVPSGAIVAYNGACPTGWSEFTTGKGRVLVGAGIGNNDSLGAALTNRAIASVGGLEYTTGIPADDTGVGISSIPNPNVVMGFEGGGNGIYGLGVANTTIGGPKADSNMPPFVVVRYCSKD